MSEQRPFIREVILEDFMSYEYSRVRLKPGLNVVLGPNGSGKSSILLGISLALGQSHTERSRRLSDLIRYGRSQARVTLLIDNTERDGGRPLPKRGDVVTLTRVIRDNGDYWFEVDYRRAERHEVVGLLRSFGLNPDNMLVIMHQGLVDEFAFLTPQERLRLVEEATGLSSYRKRLERALRRLESIKVEEKEKMKQLERLRAVEEQWRVLYERVLEKKRLVEALERLNNELLWARVARLREALTRLDDKITSLRSRVDEASGKALSLNDELRLLRSKLNTLLEGRRVDKEGLLRLVDDISSVSAEKAVLEYRIALMNKELRSLMRDRSRYEGELAELLKSATGEPGGARRLEEVEEEIRVVQARIKALRDVPDEAERLYEDIRSRIKSLEERLRELSNNKSLLVEEVKRRAGVWRRELRKLVSEVNTSFQDLLRSIGAVGYVKVTFGEAPLDGGLEIYVGFRGSTPVLLDPFRQSGGERSSTVTAFLLALQGRVVSPFRAVDEFDVHMDPANRLTFLRAMHKLFKEDKATQYLVITPGYPSYVDPDAHYLVVQKTKGVSVVEEARKKGG